MKSSAMPEITFGARQKPTDQDVISRLQSESARQDVEIDTLREALADSAERNRQLAENLAKAMGRIAELESHLAAVLATVDAATAPDGRTYAEGCKP